MNREKSTGKGTKLHYKLIMTILVLLSILISACPPLEEDPYNNTLVCKGDLDLNEWMEILNTIQIRGMPVNLDLSACEVPPLYSGSERVVLKWVDEDGNEVSQETPYVQFNPFPGFPYGKEYIRSIILPEKATMISHATNNEIPLITDDADSDLKKSAFRHFTNLRSITGKNIELIGNLAFINNKTLEEVNFNRAVRIMQYAFSGCTGLKNVRFDVAREVNTGSFENCVNLESIFLPVVEAVSERAFNNCQKLTEVNFDIATEIGKEAFKDCIKLRYARFLAGKVTSSSSSNSIIFDPNSLRGCKSLEILDVRYAWNVSFSAGALADIGEHLELFLFDDDGTHSNGHPQSDKFFLGGKEDEDGIVSLESTENGNVSLKSILIRAPDVLPPGNPQIDENDLNMSGIRNYIYSVYNKDENNEPLDPVIIEVTIQRGPVQ